MYPKTLAFLILFAMPLHAGTVSLVVDEMPAGAVVSHENPQCPTGWSAHTASEGRFIVGIDPSDVSQNVGDTFAGTNPNYNATLDLFSADISNQSSDPFVNSPFGSKLTASAGGPGSAGIYETTETPSVTVTATGTSIPPHVVHKFCEKD